MDHKPNEIDYRTVLLTVDGKLRGSKARRLQDALEAAFDDGYDQVILDLRRCASLDSVGAIAIGRALELGQRLFVISEPSYGRDDFLPPELAQHPRLALFGDPGDATRAARARNESGVLVP